MFGPSKPTRPVVSTPAPRSAADVARLSGTLLQVLVIGANPPGYLAFFNSTHVPNDQIDNILITAGAPEPGSANPATQAILSYRQGHAGPSQANLFPGTIEITGLGRRVVVVGTPDGDVSLRLGLEPSGLSTEAHGLQSLSVLLSADVISVHIKWSDGIEEDLFPT